MQLKPQDFQTFEAYKKAMRAAAGQIGNNTPFCLYSDVQMPDASKRMHTIKPFLVVGAPASTIAPMVKPLVAGKTPACSGLCSLQGGKINLVAKSGTLNYSLLKSQAGVMKDLLGKEILIPAAGGATPGAKPEPEDGIKTEFGLFTYYSKNPKFVSVVNDIVKVYGQSSDDFDETNVAYREMKDLFAKIPPREQIMKWINDGDPGGSSGNAARDAKAAYQLFDKYRREITNLRQDFEYTASSMGTALKLLSAEIMDDQAKKLKKQAEDTKEKIDTAFLLVKSAIDAAKAEEDPTEFIKDGLEAINKIVNFVATSKLVERAEKLEEEAHDLKIDGFSESITAAVKRLGDLGGRLGAARQDLQDAEAMVKLRAKAPMNIFDKITQASKGRFKFQDVEKLAERAKESRELAQNVVAGFHKVYNNAVLLSGYVHSGSWPVPDRDDDLDILKQYRDDSVKKGKTAGDIFKEATDTLDWSRKLYADAQEALTKQNSK